MTEAIIAGNIFVQDGANLPASLLLPTQSDSNGWAAAKDNRSAFEKTIEKAGWTFFFMAGEMKATVFGFDRQRALHDAMNRLTTNAKSQHCNSIEVTRVVDRSFLGVPYVSVSAHPRHLQKSMLFHG